MAEHSREGHRSRIRQNYISNGIKGMNDANMLELFLSVIVPRKDTKQLSYDLLNRFGSLENIFGASVEDLVKVNGVGENTAMVICLYKDLINRLGDLDEPINISMTNAVNRLCYAKDVFDDYDGDKTLFITVDNHDEVLGKFLFDGICGNSKKDKVAVVENLLNTNASQCVLCYNISDKIDYEKYKKYFIELRDFLTPLKITIIDVVVVSEEKSVCFSELNNYKHLF